MGCPTSKLAPCHLATFMGCGCTASLPATAAPVEIPESAGPVLLAGNRRKREKTVTINESSNELKVYKQKTVSFHSEPSHFFEDEQVRDERIKNRKSTGFARKGDLPESHERHVAFDTTSGFEHQQQNDNSRVKARKGTGFVRQDELPDSGHEQVHVNFNIHTNEHEEDGVKLRGSKRKGTGFVRKDEVPDSDVEERHVVFDTTDEPAYDKESANSRLKTRKGTGFVRKGELPDGDVEEPHVAFDTTDEPAHDKESANSRLKARKGTGFVRKDAWPGGQREEFPDSDEDGTAVAFDDDSANVHEEEKSEKMRVKAGKGKGFVWSQGVPDMDGEELLTLEPATLDLDVCTEWEPLVEIEGEERAQQVRSCWACWQS